MFICIRMCVLLYCIVFVWILYLYGYYDWHLHMCLDLYLCWYIILLRCIVLYYFLLFVVLHDRMYCM